MVTSAINNNISLSIGPLPVARFSAATKKKLDTAFWNMRLEQVRSFLKEGGWSALCERPPILLGEAISRMKKSPTVGRVDQIADSNVLEAIQEERHQILRLGREISVFRFFGTQTWLLVEGDDEGVDLPGQGEYSDVEIHSHPFSGYCLPSIEDLTSCANLFLQGLGISRNYILSHEGIVQYDIKNAIPHFVWHSPFIFFNDCLFGTDDPPPEQNDFRLKTYLQHGISIQRIDWDSFCLEDLTDQKEAHSITTLLASSGPAERVAGVNLVDVVSNYNHYGDFQLAVNILLEFSSDPSHLVQLIALSKVSDAVYAIGSKSDMGRVISAFKDSEFEIVRKKIKVLKLELGL